MNLKFIFQLVLLISINIGAFGERIDYTGYKLIRAIPQNEVQAKALFGLLSSGKYSQTGEIYFETDLIGINEFCDISVGPNALEFLENYLKSNSVNYKIHIEDYGSVLQSIFTQNDERLKMGDGRMNWDAYQPLDTIYEWVDSLPSLYQDLVTVSSIGKSFEERDLKLVKISKSGGIEPKLNYFIDGGIHAREWIGHAFVTFIIEELLTNSTQHSDLLDRIDFYIVPVVNPDGYAFGMDTGIFWRKTRQLFPGHEDCIGTDANRNFGFQWGGDQGSSSDHCSEIFRGTEAFSEPETEALRKYIKEDSGVQFQVYLNFHCCGAYWLIPWGYTSGYPSDFLDMKYAAEDAIKEIPKYRGTKWRSGHSGNAFYPTTGTSHDWAHGDPDVGIKYSYSPEMISLVPPEEIIHVCRETWLAVEQLGKFIIAEADSVKN